MALISNFNNAGEGVQVIYDVTFRPVDTTDSDIGPSIEIMIDDRREWKGLSLDAAQNKAISSSNQNSTNGNQVVYPDISPVRASFSREINFSISRSNEIIRGYTLTRIITIKAFASRNTTSIVSGSPTAAPAITPFGGAGLTYPLTVNITKVATATYTKVHALHIIGETTANIQWVLSATANVVVPWPCIILASSGNNSGVGGSSLAVFK